MAIKRKIIAGIDIGTTKVCTCIGEMRSEDIKILGSGMVPLDRGVSQGLINHLMETSRAVKESVDMAVQKADVDFSSVWVSIGGYRSHGLSLSTTRTITSRNRGIAKEDVEQVCRDAKTKINIPEDHEILHSQLQYFLLDGKAEVDDPCGMTADSLTANLFLVLTPSAVIANTRNALANADIPAIEGMVLQQIASGCGVLSPDENELGVVHINMGGGTTSLNVIHRNRLLYTSVLPVGACQITKDLAITLRTPLNEAEKLKLRLGSVSLDSITPEEVVEISLIGTNQANRIPRVTVCEIIHERCSEILAAVQRELDKINLRREAFTGIVLTGGGARLHGMASLTESMLQMPVRIGGSNQVPAVKGEVPDIMHATAAGTLVYARDRLNQNYFVLDEKRPSEKKRSKFEAFRDWMLGEGGS